MRLPAKVRLPEEKGHNRKAGTERNVYVESHPNDRNAWLTAQFDAQRPQLQAVAYRMLGSLSEAEDAVQEAWLRLQRADTGDVANLGGWLTTVVARLCLDMLRARKARREEELTPDTAPLPARAGDPEAEALLADSVGLALLVVLETLTPSERLAFVLHDLFAVPFDEIAPVIERTPTAARQLASRARRRIQGTDTVHDTVASPARNLAHQRRMVEAFLTASRQGEFEALLAILDPNAVQRMDRFVVPSGVAQEMHGAQAIARRAARAGKGGAKAAQSALIDGKVGMVVAPQGRLVMVLLFTIGAEDDAHGAGGKITAIDVVADPARLAQLEIAILPTS